MANSALAGAAKAATCWYNDRSGVAKNNGAQIMAYRRRLSMAAWRNSKRRRQQQQQQTTLTGQQYGARM